MVYDERLAKLGNMINDRKVVSEIKKELLEILFDDFATQIEGKDSSELEGTLEKDFLIQVYGPRDEGIDQILKLQEMGELGSLADDYHITFEEIYGYEAQGYKAVWDYDEYFLKLREESKKLRKNKAK